MDDALVDLLREDLERAEYSAAGVRALLGSAADEARARGVFTPARRALGERRESPLGTLIRLFLLGEALAEEELAAALPSLGAAGAVRLGLVEGDADEFRAALSLNPVELPDSAGETGAIASWWILSDLDDQLRRGPARPDHVMGVGGATRSLIAQALLGRGTEPPGSVLDLGTGCGIVALHLARSGARRVVATDISARALGLARANARLNGLEGRIDFRAGDLFEPVAGERFDLVLSNPPFVITPRGDDSVPRYEYRDGGMRGDELAARVVREAPALLNPGGTLLCLANWETPWGGRGLARVGEWIEAGAEGLGGEGSLAGWAIERELLDPARYAETWARDGGARPGEAGFEVLMEAWLREFADRRVVSIGLGSVRIRRCAAGEAAAIRLEHADGPFAREPGPGLAAAFAAGIAAERMSDAEILAVRWVRDEAVAELREHVPGEEGPRSISLRTERPIARTVVADPLLAAAVGACDGELSLARIADALATLLEVDAEAAAEALVAGFRELVWFGMLRAPVD